MLHHAALPADCNLAIRCRQVSGDLGFRLTDEACLSHTAHRLQAAEDLLDLLSFSLADLVALGAGRSFIQARFLASVDPGKVRPDVVIPLVLDEVLHVVALVGPQGLRVDLPAPRTGEQLAGRLMFIEGHLPSVIDSGTTILRQIVPGQLNSQLQQIGSLPGFRLLQGGV